MIAKYQQDDEGITIHTDAPLNTDEKTFREFTAAVEKLDGVAVAATGRYFVDCAFGLLFAPDQVSIQILNLFKSTFELSAVELLDTEALMRLKGISVPSFGTSQGFSQA